jgi:hypothetical protein
MQTTPNNWYNKFVSKYFMREISNVIIKEIKADINMIRSIEIHKSILEARILCPEFTIDYVGILYDAEYINDTDLQKIFEINDIKMLKFLVSRSTKQIANYKANIIYNMERFGSNRFVATTESTESDTESVETVAIEPT